jgi:ABC-type polysaccharide/polyol phosphate export permease
MSGTLRDIISLNPLTPVFVLARKWIIDPSAPGPELWVAPLVIFLVLCGLAVWVFNREAPRIAEEL